MSQTYVILAALLVTGCAGSRQTDAPSSQHEAPAEPVSVDLEEISRSPRNDRSAHPNKPNGIEYRFRRWVPPGTPDFIPRQVDSLHLAIADETPEGWLAFFESPLQGIGPNQAYRARLYDRGGRILWEVALNQFFNRPTRLEVQDIRYRDGTLYFNAACQTYAREAGGECSALISIDPAAQRLNWRTPYLTSNDIFILYGSYLIAGYGFTAEPDFLYVIDSRSGEIVETVPLDTAHDYLEVAGDTLRVITTDSAYLFRLPGL